MKHKTQRTSKAPIGRKLPMSEYRDENTHLSLQRAVSDESPLGGNQIGNLRIAEEWKTCLLTSPSPIPVHQTATERRSSTAERNEEKKERRSGKRNDSFHIMPDLSETITYFDGVADKYKAENG